MSLIVSVKIFCSGSVYTGILWSMVVICRNEVFIERHEA